MKRMRRGSVRLLIILVYFLVALVPITLLSGMMLSNYFNRIEEEMTQSILQALKQVSMNMAGYFQNAQRVADNLAVNDDIQTALLAGPRQQTIEAQFDEMTKLRSLFLSTAQSTGISSIRIFVDDTKLYANEKIEFFPLSSFQDAAGYPDATPKGAFRLHTVKTVVDDQPRQVITYVRQIRSIRQIGRSIGGLCVDINVSRLQLLLQELEYSHSYALLLVDDEGRVITGNASGLQPEGTVAPELLRAAQGGVVKQGEELYAVKEIETLRWYLVAVVPQASLRASTFAARTDVLLFFAAVLLVVVLLVILSFVLVDGMARRVQQLVSVLDDKSLPKDLVCAPHARFGLFGRLDASLSGAKELIKTVCEQMEQLHETQLQMLQEQINPHFLYNALDTINWMVRNGGQDSACQTISALTRYLRLILNNGRDIVTAQDEVSLAEAYIEIQRQRFGDSFTVEIILEPEAAACLLPKMTLQPLVENALLHGLQKLRGREARIDVDIYVDDGALILSVTDNGVGMTTQTAGGLTQTNHSGSGFGIYNVNQRIILFSGSPAYGLSVESEEGRFTTVTVRAAERREQERKLGA